MCSDAQQRARAGGELWWSICEQRARDGERAGVLEAEGNSVIFDAYDLALRVTFVTIRTKRLAGASARALVAAARENSSLFVGLRSDDRDEPTGSVRVARAHAGGRCDTRRATSRAIPPRPESRRHIPSCENRARAPSLSRSRRRIPTAFDIRP